VIGPCFNNALIKVDPSARSGGGEPQATISLSNGGFFGQPLERWLLAPKAPTQGFDRWIPLGSSWPDRLRALRSFGVRRLVLLGGASLAAELLQADCVDALQLTLVPTLLGGAHTWLPVEQGLLPVQMMGLGAWGCDGVEDLGDGEMMLRYRRQRLH
jgi:5-amino-6-(5-phosphoribosylamino)uracil reductase